MYDLIVIGDDLSSHVAAAYACQNGMNTLLIAESGLGGLQLLGDFVFPVDPTPITGLGPEELGRGILTELGMTWPEDESPSVNPAYQVILPEHRIDFFNNPVALFSELAREFPAHDEDIRDFYSIAQSASSALHNWISAHPHIQPQSLQDYFYYLKLYPHVFRYKFGAVKFDKILSQNPALEKVWEAQHALLGFNQSDLFSFGSALQYSAPLRGISFFSQGKQFLFNELIKKIESCKGVYLTPCEILSISKGKLIDLEMKAKDGSTSKVSGHHLIISTKSDKVMKLSDKPINFSDQMRPAKIVFYPFTLFLGISRKCLPEQIAPHIAVVSDVNKSLFDDNLIILDTGLPDKNRQMSDAKTSLTATIFLSPDPENWKWDALKNKASDALARLEFFLPFLKDNMELHNIDQSIDISIAYRSVVTPKYEVRNALLTSFAAKSHKTKFGNIFLTGASLLSDAGFDAEILSGKNAAMQVIQKRKSIYDT
jgi:hypothetical protein